MGGLFLIAMAGFAMILANSAIAPAYFATLAYHTGPILSPKFGPMTVQLWINEALMALFFLFVTLEIKREFVDGRLCNWKQRGLPVVAALSGLVLPALVFLTVSRNSPGLASGWAIPAATDIAFAMGVLALLGRHAPASLKLLLVTIAVVDDMAAVAIIALFYTSSLKLVPLGLAALIWVAMGALNRRRVFALTPYLIGFGLLWYFLLQAGIHATVSGPLAAATIPFVRTLGAPDAPTSPLHRIEHALSNPVAFGVLPLFAFANAGVTLGDDFAWQLMSPLPLAIALGLFLGKPIGLFGSIRLAAHLGFGARPLGANWRQVLGMAWLGGIGFTMSLFIALLAFPHDPHLIDQAKIGVVTGSLFSALAGYLVLRFGSGRRLSTQASD